MKTINTSGKYLIVKKRRYLFDFIAMNLIRGYAIHLPFRNFLSATTFISRLVFKFTYNAGVNNLQISQLDEQLKWRIGRNEETENNT